MADQDVTELVEDTAPDTSDMMYEGKDPDGAPLDRSIRHSVLQKLIASAQKNRNLLINGCMRLSQRGFAGATAWATATYSLDRYRWTGSGAGVITATHSTDGPAGTAFKKCLRIDVTTADAALGATDEYFVQQRIEAQNLQHLLYGNAAAKTITLSFWVKCKITGQMGGFLWQFDPGTARNYSIGYTINSADTWEKKTITITGDASGQIDNNNGEGLGVSFSLGMGTDDDSGTKDVWENAVAEPNNTHVDPSWNTNIMASTDNYLCITGVQLEVGDVATDFDYEPIDELIAKCQRYYCKSYSIDVAPATNTTAGQVYFRSTGHADSDHTINYHVSFPVEMRTPPLTHTYDNAEAEDKVTMEKGSGVAASMVHKSANSMNVAGTNGEAGVTRILSFHWTSEAEL